MWEVWEKGDHRWFEGFAFFICQFPEGPSLAFKAPVPSSLTSCTSLDTLSSQGFIQSTASHPGSFHQYPALHNRAQRTSVHTTWPRVYIYLMAFCVLQPLPGSGAPITSAVFSCSLELTLLPALPAFPPQPGCLPHFPEISVAASPPLGSLLWSASLAGINPHSSPKPLP